ncbi:nickel/cobalt transporter [Litchfieldella rifensis]|uniref:Nickel/cobalt efflux system n=1 Tax=Litchfieldella rifensis TaxID=762643 RepID=A0ABV7LM79_9GAMM
MRRLSPAAKAACALLPILVGALLLYWLYQGGGQGLGLQIVAWQRDLHRALTLAITELSGSPSPAAWATLLAVSFGYGVFHAAGPGHGKAVLTTYLLSQGGALRRALALSCAASLLQALVAISLVAVLVHGLGWLTRQAMGSVMWVEQASFLMVTLLGLWLCARALRQLRRRPAAVSAAGEHRQVHDPAPHRHDHHCGCGSAHHVDPLKTGDWRTAVATVVAIGIRPCSGGVLLLGAASLLGQFWVGVAAVLVMAVGTSLAVSALALASVVARGWAERRLVRHHGGRRVQRALGWAALGGGMAIVMLGVSLSVAGAASPGGAPLLGEPPAHDGGAAVPRSPFGPGD